MRRFIRHNPRATAPAHRRRAGAWRGGCWMGLCLAATLVSAQGVADGVDAAPRPASAASAADRAAEAAVVLPAPETTDTPAAAGPTGLAADLHEAVHRLPVTVRDAYGREVTRDIALTSFRPAGAGPFPLLVLNHGRGPAEQRATQGRQRFEPQARYFVAKGFAVLVPTRLGYGDTVGDFDPEASGPCDRVRLEPVAEAAASQVLAAVAWARQQPWVNAERWVVAGASVGGFTTLAVAASRPPGLVAAINFVGGATGNPITRPGDPCAPRAIAQLWRAQSAAAAPAALPMLWLYWLNDRYWGADWPQRWAQAWREGGAPLQFHQLPAVGEDGHAGMGVDMDRWVPLVETFLAEAGFRQPGTVPRPPPSAFATLDRADALPLPTARREAALRRFLAMAPPRALAIGPQGAWGVARGDWALGRALGWCQRTRGQPCRLYAVDDQVVWAP